MFLETGMCHTLSTQDVASLPSDLSFHQNLTSANADDAREILAGSVPFPDVAAILDFLRLNDTGAWVRQEFVLGNDLLLYSLPDGAIRLAAYTPPLTSASVAYVFCLGLLPAPEAVVGTDLGRARVRGHGVRDVRDPWHLVPRVGSFIRLSPG